jgi:hypothetical protein
VGGATVVKGSRYSKGGGDDRVPVPATCAP